MRAGLTFFYETRKNAAWPGTRYEPLAPRPFAAYSGGGSGRAEDRSRRKLGEESPNTAGRDAA